MNWNGLTGCGAVRLTVFKGLCAKGKINNQCRRCSTGKKSMNNLASINSVYLFLDKWKTGDSQAILLHWSFFISLNLILRHVSRNSCEINCFYMLKNVLWHDFNLLSVFYKLWMRISCKYFWKHGKFFSRVIFIFITNFIICKFFFFESIFYST